MSKKYDVVVGYDGSDGANAALRELPLAYLPRKGSMVVVCATDVFLPMTTGEAIPAGIEQAIRASQIESKRRVDEAAKTAEKGAKFLKEKFPLWNIDFEGCPDSPAWAIIKKAEVSQSKLVVVGARGHAALGRFIGSVSQTVVSQVPCSVRVARWEGAPKSKRMKILIAIDGSPDSKKAVARVAERLWPIQTELKLITVIDPRKSTFLDRLAPPTIRWFIDKANDEKSAAGRMLEIYGKKLRDLDLPLSMNVVVGKPQEEILSTAQKWGAHCIYMGARGLTHMKRFILGGVSCAVSARAHCSVEIVR